MKVKLSSIAPHRKHLWKSFRSHQIAQHILILYLFHFIVNRFIMQRKNDELNRHKAMIRLIKRNENFIMMVTMTITTTIL